MIKAQVLVGGRGKAGGVKLAGSARRGRARRRRHPRHGHQGHPGPQGPGRARPPTSSRSSTWRPSSTGPPADPADGLGRGRRRDRAGRRRATPRRSSAIHADPLIGLPTSRPASWRSRMGSAAHLKAAVAIAKGLVRTMLAYDADLVEINPLAIVREAGADGAAAERLVCLDAKVTLDDSALPRHPELEDAARPRRGGPGRPRGARGRASPSSSSTARSAAWSTAPAWR